MLTSFLTRLRAGETDFEDTIAVVNAIYSYTPTRFVNGLTTPVINEAGQNEGSCRIFAFAQLNALTEADTLACFGRFYRDVLNEPTGTSHGNIRAFMRDGWAGVQFEGEVLQPK
jgi:hypothetical protein